MDLIGGCSCAPVFIRAAVPKRGKRQEKGDVHAHKIRYNYHYQHADSTLVFRYDNAPHYPDLPGFPEHKHDGEQVLSAPAPDLSQVLRETNGYLYPDTATDQEEK